MNNLKEKIMFILFIILTLFLPLTIMWAFVQMPLTDDVRVFVGSAHQAETNNLLFPHNVDTAWELKPIGNRVLWFFITKISDITNNPYGIQLISLLAAVIVSILLAGKLTKYIHGKYDFLYTTLLLALITPFNLLLMQSEWWAVLFSFLALWLLLREDTTSMALAGILAVFIFSLKLSTIVMIPTIFVAYLLLAGYSKKSTIQATISYFGGAVAGGLIGLFWLVWLPNIIPDTFFSMSVAHASKGVAISPLETIGYFIYYMFQQFMSLPVLLAGVVSVLILVSICLMLWINSDEKKEPTIHLLLVVLLWLLPCFAVIIQGEFFAYHYMMLAFPAVISTLLLGNVVDCNLRDIFYIVVIVSIAFFWIMHCSIWSPNYPPQESFWKQADTDYSHIETTYNLSKQPSVLYLTGPNALYWWKPPSACRQVGSLAILYNMTWTKEYRETKSCIENYRGKYAITAHKIENNIPGMGRNETNRMPQNYLQNYTLIEETTNWDIYQRLVT